MAAPTDPVVISRLVALEAFEASAKLRMTDYDQQFQTDGQHLDAITTDIEGLTDGEKAINTTIANNAAVLGTIADRVTALEATVKALQQGPVTPTPPVTPPVTPPPAPAFRATLGGWKLSFPFARGAIAVDWASRTLWVGGALQVDPRIAVYDLPDMGQGTDPTTWPVLAPKAFIDAAVFQQGDAAVMVSGLVFWQGEVWIATLKYYDTAPPSTLTLYSASGKQITLNIPRGHFGGFVKPKDGSSPYLGTAGNTSGQPGTAGMTLARIDGTVLLDAAAFNAPFEQREPRDPDVWPAGPSDQWPGAGTDQWFCYNPRLDANGVKRQVWASDIVMGGGLLTPTAMLYWPFLGTGPTDYSYQSPLPGRPAPVVGFALAGKTCEYTRALAADGSVGPPSWVQTPLKGVGGQEWGPNKEILLCEQNVHQGPTNIYQTDPWIRVLAP